MQKTAIFLALALVLGACGEADDTPAGTTFDPPAWVLGLQDVGGSPNTPTDGTSAPTPSFHGMRTTIAGVAEPLIVPESNVAEQPTQLTRFISGTGTADDGETFVTIGFTVLITTNAPATLSLTVAPPNTDEASLLYSEGTTDTAAQVVTGITSGVLDLDRWNDAQVRGTFNADLYLQNGARRTLSEGVIDVRLNP